MNAIVLNVMWETFTILYLLQTNLMLIKTINSTLSSSSNKSFEQHLILVHGSIRYLVGCLAGIGSGIINHLWQRYRARTKIPYAILKQLENISLLINR